MKALYAHLFEPETRVKKRDVMHRMHTGENSPVADVNEVKAKLKKQRTLSVQQLNELAQKFLETLSSDDSIQSFLSQDGEEAAQRILQIVGDTSMVYANNSGTVQEVENYLDQLGVKVCHNYLLDQEVKDNRISSPWLLPVNNLEPSEEWFAIQKTFPLGRVAGERKCNGVTALIGVNSAAADTGELFLLQHTSNIERLLQAERIIFLVGMEKIVPSSEIASYQTAWAGNFGLQHVLMNLVKTEDGGNEDQNCHPVFQEKMIKTPEVSVIVLDNGRTGLVGTEFEPVLRCISCRSCIRECPNYTFFGKAKGRYPQQYLFHHLIGNEDNLDLCSFCNNCTYECPVGIETAKMNSLAKGRVHSPVARCKTRLLGNTELLANATRYMVPLAEQVFKNSLVREINHNTLGVHRERILPVYDKAPLMKPTLKEVPAKTVIYYAGCWSAFFDHEVYNSVLKIFDLLGYQVIVADAKCCGLPLIASGEVDAARKKGRRLIDSLLTLDRGIDIITSCPSCSLALKKDYKPLGIKDAEKVSGRVYDILDYLNNLEEVKNGTLRFSEYPAEMVYHLPCHQRVQGLGHVTLDALDRVPELKVNDVERGCCGISGAWGNKKQFYDYSMVTGNEVFDAVDPQRYSAIVTECGTCKMQMVHGTKMRTLHPITILAESAHVDK